MPACMSPAVVGASTISFAAAGELAQGADAGVLVAGGGGGEHDLVRRGRHPPAGEHHRYPLAAHRVVREALHRDLPGLRPADPRVVDPGDVRIGGHRPQDLVYRPEVLAVEPEEGLQLEGLAEAP